MTLEVDNQLQNLLIGNVQVTEDGRFVMPAKDNISTGDLLDTVQYYQNNMLERV